jgi:fermentation-respiration switch protein FrsA (DUF1100 family)
LTPRHALLTAALLAISVPLLIGATVALFEDRLIYQPTRDLIATPATVGLPYEDVRFGPGGRLHGWLIPGSGRTTVLLIHGNGGNIGHRVGVAAWLRSGLEATLFLFDYQGYGHSAGHPSEAGLIEDSRAALAYLRSRREVDPARIAYFGESIGAVPAVELALEDPPYRLILQSAFTSLPDLAADHSPYLPIGRIFRSRFPTIDRIGRVRAPVLIAHGTADDLVPVDHARRLHAAAPEPKGLHLIEGAGHNDIYQVGGARYLRILANFLGASE